MRKDIVEKLKHENRIRKAGDIGTLALAYKNIEKASAEDYMGSGIILSISNINFDRSVIVQDVLITDGLSPDTIAAIARDIKRSYLDKVTLVSSSFQCKVEDVAEKKSV